MSENHFKVALQQWLESSKLKQKYQETQLIESWETIMGATIARYTEKVYISNHILYVKISSAPLKNELHMSRSKIIALLNESLGKEVILDVRIL